MKNKKKKQSIVIKEIYEKHKKEVTGINTDKGTQIVTYEEKNKQNMKKEVLGFTAGNFDLLHPGYIITFEEAKRHCDNFIVFLQKDPSQHRKSKYKPVIPLYDRYKALMSIKHIDAVYIYQTEKELYNLIKFWKPDIRILGEDYIGDNGKHKPFTGDDLPPKVIYTSRSHDWSTTKLKDLITKQTIKQNPDIYKK